MIALSGRTYRISVHILTKYCNLNPFFSITYILLDLSVSKNIIKSLLLSRNISITIILRYSNFVYLITLNISMNLVLV